MKFSDRGLLRLQVDGTFTPHAIPRQGKVNFCLKVPCIESALLVDKSRREPVVYYPDFDARIGIPMDIRDEVSKELPRDMEGVEFVLL